MTDLLDTYLENRRIVQPNNANNLGSVHGGNVTKWMDEVSALSAMRFAGETCVTVRMNRVDFRQPIPEGETALIDAYVYVAVDGERRPTPVPELTVATDEAERLQKTALSGESTEDA